MRFARQKIHFMGIGGIGMSALAGLARERGATVSGCDAAANDRTRALAQAGVEIQTGHSPAHVAAVDLLVHTAAVPPDHPEIAAAKRAMRRGEFLAAALAADEVIGVAGAHGKTTTTLMITQIFLAAGKDPTVLLGGVSAQLRGNYRCGGRLDGARLDGARLDGARLAVAELDESDGAFLLPRLAVGVVTNVEPEHLAYYRDFANVVAAFRQFADQIPPENFLVANLDNAAAAEIFHRRAGNKIGYGKNARDGWHWRDRRCRDGDQRATIFRGEREIGELRLPFIGEHNLTDALAALAVADIYAVAPDAALAALAECAGAERRWEKLGEWGGAAIFSDYAHHPTEIRATLTGARENYRGKMLVVFQPHLFSRTRDLADEFAAALTLADKVILTDIYPAREAPLTGVTAALITDAMPPEKLAAPAPLPLAEAVALARTMADAFAVVVFMGAGDLDEFARQAFSGQEH
ncbi:MAG: UDP-N-acetylmuramate--L-alanine ligase [Planctomycetota bacterium]|jgi:UDP-N-acetylmuramate--alanine ligase|nr:UDP-N-acetylmuramate--L-alanine ligase [Planctomycetota bacterium]